MEAHTNLINFRRHALPAHFHITEEVGAKEAALSVSSAPARLGWFATWWLDTRSPNSTVYYPER